MRNRNYKLTYMKYTDTEIDDIATDIAVTRGSQERRDAIKKLITELQEESAKVISPNLPVSGQFSLAIVKKAFETFHYVGFPHNHPTWEEWAKENLH